MSEMSAVDLVDVNADLVKMTELVGRAISDATSALLNGDLALAQQVISGDEPLNELNAGIEDKYHRLPIERKAEA